MRGWKIVAALVLLSLAGTAAWHLKHKDEGALPGPIVENTPAPASLAPDAADSSVEANEPSPSFAPIPPADVSDGSVIAAVNDLAPQLVQWLTPSDQVRKWVAFVDQLAEGKLSQNNRPLDYPMAPFRANQHESHLLLDRFNYRRAEWLIDVITQISPTNLARTYQVWRPQMNTAYRELGGKGGFDKRLRKAIKQIVTVPSLTSPPELIRSGVYFLYADPKLEQATDVEKLLWRIGPDNTEHLQSYLRQLEPQLWAPIDNSKPIKAA